MSIGVLDALGRHADSSRAIQARSGPCSETGNSRISQASSLYLLVLLRDLASAQDHRTAPLPEHGPAILISNHTCGIDHVLLQAACDRLLGFMVAREYYEIPLLEPWCRLVGCIPVNRDGRDFAATRAAIRALKDGRRAAHFSGGPHRARVGPATR